MNIFNDISLSLLNKNLDGLWMRQQVTMENLANSSTPNYKSKYVDFEHALQDKISMINNEDNAKVSDINNEIGDSQFIQGVNNNQTSRLDGNNVDVESEQLELSKTQYNYYYTVSELNSYFSKLKLAINGGK